MPSATEQDRPNRLETCTLSETCTKDRHNNKNKQHVLYRNGIDPLTSSTEQDNRIVYNPVKWINNKVTTSMPHGNKINTHMAQTKAQYSQKNNCTLTVLLLTHYPSSWI